MVSTVVRLFQLITYTSTATNTHVDFSWGKGNILEIKNQYDSGGSEYKGTENCTVWSMDPAEHCYGLGQLSPTFLIL